MKPTLVFDSGWGYLSRRPDGGVDIVRQDRLGTGNAMFRCVDAEPVSLPKDEANALARFIMSLPIITPPSPEVFHDLGHKIP